MLILHNLFQILKTTLYYKTAVAAAAAKSLQSCPTLARPHRWQPNRLPRPWDSPGKNTGVHCHFVLQCMKVKSESEVVQSCPTLGNTSYCTLKMYITHTHGPAIPLQNISPETLLYMAKKAFIK